MPRLVRVSLVHRQALNATVVMMTRPPKALTFSPAVYMRALRAYMRMSQRELSRRTGVEQAEICRIERGRIDPQLGTLRRLFDGLFCDLLVLPRPRKRPGDALAELDAVTKRWWRHRHSRWSGKNAKIPP